MQVYARFTSNTGGNPGETTVTVDVTRVVRATGVSDFPVNGASVNCLAAGHCWYELDPDFATYDYLVTFYGTSFAVTLDKTSICVVVTPAPADLRLINGADFNLLSTLDGVAVFDRSPVKADHLDIYKADYYSSADGAGRTLPFTFDGDEPWPDTLSEAHFYCTPTAATLDDDPTAVGLSAVACTVNTPSGSGRKVTLTLTNTQTDTLVSGVNAYTFGLVANKSTHRATLRSGTLTVRPDPAD